MFGASGLLERVRSIFLVVALVNLTGAAAAFMLGGAMGPVQGVALASALWLAGSLLATFTRWQDRRLLLVDLVDSVAMVGSALALDDAGMIIGPLLATFMFRSLYGGYREACARFALYSGAYAAAAVLAAEQGRLASDVTVILGGTVVGLLSLTLVMPMLRQALLGRDAATARLEVLAWAAAELLSARTAAEVSAIAWRGQARLAIGSPDLAAFLLVDHGDRLAVVTPDEASDVGRSGTDGSSGGRWVPADALACVLDGEKRCLVLTREPADELVALAPQARHWALIPSAPSDPRRRILALAAPGTISRELAAATESLMRHISLAYANTSANEELRWLALHDPLTGLPNRKCLLQELKNHVGGDAGASAALLFCDLDAFKAVNDTHGHAAGDALLEIVATRIRENVRADDVAARLGGDEFAVLLPSTSLAQARLVAERLSAVVTAPVDLGAAVATVGVSIGVAVLEPGTSAMDALRAADEAMYGEKSRRIAAPARPSGAPAVPVP